MVGCVFPPIMCLCCHGVAAFLPLTPSEPFLSKQHMCLPNEDGWRSAGWILRDAEEEESGGGEGKMKAECTTTTTKKREGGKQRQRKERMQTERGRESKARLMGEGRRDWENKVGTEKDGGGWGTYWGASYVDWAVNMVSFLCGHPGLGPRPKNGGTLLW